MEQVRTYTPSRCRARVVAKSAQLRFCLRRKLCSLPCSSFPHATRFAGLARGPHIRAVALSERDGGCAPKPLPHSAERRSIFIAIFHCPVKIIQRSKGRSAVAAAAYRSGEKLTNEWDGEIHDYTHKGGIVHREIMLPAHAPPDFADRSTLWNSVEKIEKSSDAQLAREVEVAFPVELSPAAQLGNH